MSFSCQESVQTRSAIEKLVGSEITIPVGLQATIDGEDTTLTATEQPDAKMVVWYDSVGCSSCQISRLNEWTEMLAYAEALRGKFQVVFVMTPKNKEMKSVRISLMSSRLGHPMLIDTASAFITANPLVPADSRLHTFLLDKNNRVVLVGSPVNGESLRVLYKETIKTLVNNAGKMPE